ncbi:MAG: hypothetical protein ACRCY8_05020 [Dermatophilaceae bacterium]
MTRTVALLAAPFAVLVGAAASIANDWLPGRVGWRSWFYTVFLAALVVYVTLTADEAESILVAAFATGFVTSRYVRLLILRIRHRRRHD